MEEKLVKLQIWDTAGQERFRTIAKSFYKGADGIILTYDVTGYKSFDKIRGWIKEINNYSKLDVSKVLIGNKKDRQDRLVTYEEGAKLAN